LTFIDDGVYLYVEGGEKMKKALGILTIVLIGAFCISLAAFAQDFGDQFLKGAIKGAATGAAASAASGGKAGKGAAVGAGVGIFSDLLFGAMEKSKTEAPVQTTGLVPEDAYQRGFQQGFTNGYQQGYQQGYSEGVAKTE